MRKIKFLIVLFCLMIVPALCISQNGYPKLIVLQGDTVVAITKDQQRSINLVKVERDYYKEYSDSLIVSLGLSGVALVDCNELIDHFKKEIQLNGHLNKEQSTFIKLLKEESKKKDIKIKMFKQLTWVFGLLSILFLLIIVL